MAVFVMGKRNFALLVDRGEAGINKLGHPFVNGIGVVKIDDKLAAKQPKSSYKKKQKD